MSAVALHIQSLRCKMLRVLAVPWCLAPAALMARFASALKAMSKELCNWATALSSWLWISLTECHLKISFFNLIELNESTPVQEAFVSCL